MPVVVLFVSNYIFRHEDITHVSAQCEYVKRHINIMRMFDKSIDNQDDASYQMLIL